MLGDAEAALALGGTSLDLCWLLAVLGLAPARLACIGEIGIEPQCTYNISEMLISGIFVNANTPSQLLSAWPQGCQLPRACPSDCWSTTS